MSETAAKFVTKAIGAFEIKDADKGEVEARLGIVGQVDLDRDVFLPGSTDPNNKVKLSYYGHDVVKQGAPPVGIGTVVERGGQIILQGRFFLNTERGRESFETVKALGADGEWSIGFPESSVVEAELTSDWRAKGAKRLIAKYVPVEASPVFMGAQPHTATLAVKSDDEMAAGKEAAGAPSEVAVKVADESLTGRIDAVRNALWMRNDRSAQPWYAREIFDSYVIVESGAALLRVEYTIDAEGAVTLGDAVEVEIVYQPVQSSEGKAAAEEVEAKAAELEVGPVAPAVEAPSGEVEAKEADAVRLAAETLAREAADEFDRFRRTLRRLGAV